MADLPVVSGAQAARAFQRAGWQRVKPRKKKGSHIFYLARPGVFVKLSVPDHDTLDRGLLRALIRDAGLTVDEFKKHLK